MRFDAENSELLVFTFKEGLLSRVAHDLKLRARRFLIEVDPAAGSVKAQVDLGALEVLCAMREGREAHELLSPSDREEIEDKLRAKVLEVRRYPNARFEGLVEGGKISGQLELHGVKREVAGQLAHEPGRDVCEFSLDQREFEIEPYQALLGALKVKPGVVIRICVPAA